MASTIEVPGGPNRNSSTRRSLARPAVATRHDASHVVPWWRRLADRLLGRSGAPRTVAGEASSDDGVRQVLARFQQHIGFQFRDVTLLQQALTHRSWLGATGSDLRTSNERMEFLGDSVLELVVNEFLYGHYPDRQEGDLTKMKSLLVSRGVLCTRALEMDLGSFIFLSDAERDSGGCERASILADAFEAVIGAIYLDDGLASARTFIDRRLLSKADLVLDDHDHTNFKSQLQEHVQAEYRTYPRYRVSAQSGPDHRRIFTVEVVVRGARMGEGHGPNKKTAEQAAARDALQRLKRGRLVPLSDTDDEPIEEGPIS